MLGGTVSADSQLGVGSVFRFTFPFRETFDAIEPLEPIEIIEEPTLIPAEITNRGNTLPHILLVEDNPNLQQYISTVLSEKYRITIAENGQEALEQLTVGSRQFADNKSKLPTASGATAYCKLE